MQFSLVSSSSYCLRKPSPVSYVQATHIHRVSQSRASSLKVKSSTFDEQQTFDVQNFGEELKTKWDAVENKTTVALYGVGTIAVTWIAFSLISSVNTVPLLPEFMELIGFGYSAWFVYRYLLFKTSREELKQGVQGLKEKTTVRTTTTTEEVDIPNLKTSTIVEELKENVDTGSKMETVAPIEELRQDLSAQSQQFIESAESVEQDAAAAAAAAAPPAVDQNQGVGGRKLQAVKAQETFDPKTGVRCFVDSEGHLQCEKLAPGDYIVKQTSTQPHEDGAVPGLTYCYVTEEGSMFCEGLKEGEYHVQTATQVDLEKLLEAARQSE